jgi:hypothetical protein
MTVLRGNFDLMVQSTCNLHCKNCSVLDWKGGEYPGQTMKFKDVININEKLIGLGVTLEKLTLLGGEPTLNKDIIKIINYLSEFKNKTFKELKLITNGLNLKEDIVKSFEGLDGLRISIYPHNLNMKEELVRSPLYKYLQSITNLEIIDCKYFFVNGLKDPRYEYSKELNWKRCWKKYWCRHLTIDGLYRCDILENVGQELCDMKDKNELINYVHSNDPYEYCEKCPQPALMKPWQSNNLKVDNRNAERGLSLIRNWN